MSLFVWLFTFAINCGTENSSQQTLLQCLSIEMVFSNEDKIFITARRYASAVLAVTVCLSV